MRVGYLMQLVYYELVLILLQMEDSGFIPFLLPICKNGVEELNQLM
jgi:hypothetical protein